ncbi:hypothetical protein RF11_15680 [Thelohanellus kitauei]|uniref:Uncharacterized protein n=1 Tax=Thelohanellus kitauei TaxID=669202 RepID=A0A0C2N0J9_THEKT|nr:hypothetical protein RF11_15680 [Thelohanellus kitauei]
MEEEIIKETQSQMLGAYGELHTLSEDEQRVFDDAVKCIKSCKLKMAKYSAYIPLLEGHAGVRVKVQIVAGRNFCFEIITTSKETPKLFMKVFEGLPCNPQFEVEDLRAECDC